MAVKIFSSQAVPSGILRSVALGITASALLVGCGAIYHPSFAPSEKSLFIKDDERFPYDLQIVNLTIAAAQEANVRWPYNPRPLPGQLQGTGQFGAAPAPYSPTRLAQADGPVAVYATSQSSASNRLPEDPIISYKIGKGDVLQIANVATNDQNNADAQLQNSYLVDQQGRIFVPQLDYINVEGKDVEQVRSEVLERMKKVYISPVALVNVTDFKSQFYSITGRSIRPLAAPVTMDPVTLRQALLKVATDSTIYDAATVELVRKNGQRYRVPYSSIAYEGGGSRTVMRDGDQVIVQDPSGEEARQAELTRTLESVNIDKDRLRLQREQIVSQESQRRLAEQQLLLSRNDDVRSQENLRLSQERIALERARLAQAEADARRAEQQLELQRLREQREDQQLELQRLREQREAEAGTLQAQREQREQEAFKFQRLKNERDQAAFDLQRLKDQREQSQLELQIAREERERTAFNLQQAKDNREQAALELQRAGDERANALLELQRAQAERDNAQLTIQQRNADIQARNTDLLERNANRSDQELELRRGQFDLSREEQILRERADERGRATLELSRLETAERLDSLARDYVYVTGEVGRTTRMPMPFGSTISLADALFESEGINPREGDPRGIHVIRTDNADSVRAKVYIFKLNAQNIANLSAATVFKLRPDDTIYVTPQPVTNWNRTLTQLLGGTNTLLGAGTRFITP